MSKQRLHNARVIIESYTIGSTITSFIPIPLVNGAVTGAGTVAMIEQLSNLYGVDYSRKAGEQVLVAVGAGLQSAWLTTLVNKGVPFFGVLVANVPAAVLNGGLTYVIGRALVDHFEGGGVLGDFEPELVYGYLRVSG